MSKTASEFSDHIYKLVNSGELTLNTYRTWLSWEYHISLLKTLLREKINKDYAESYDKEYFVRYQRQNLLTCCSMLNNNTSQTKNMLEIAEVEIIAEFLEKHEKYNLAQ